MACCVWVGKYVHATCSHRLHEKVHMVCKTVQVLLQLCLARAHVFRAKRS
jgi:hypothetical protein